jgi:hypothetical protein
VSTVSPAKQASSARVESLGVLEHLMTRLRARAAAACLVTIATAGCTGGDGKRTTAAPPAPAPATQRADGASADMHKGERVTLEVPDWTVARAAAAAAEPGGARLVLSGVQLTAADKFRVFVNNPAADAATTDDPGAGYVGTLAKFPAESPPGDFAIDVSKALGRVAKATGPEQPVSITLVPMQPTSTTANRRPATIEVQAVRIDKR